MTKHWYHYLWIYSLIFFSLGFFNIIFAWLGLISFALPLYFAIFRGNKNFCNRYCDRGQLLRMLGSQLGFSKGHEMPNWLKGRAFRYGFMVFFFGTFGAILYATYLVATGEQNFSASLTLFWLFDFAFDIGTNGQTAATYFALRLYGFLLTSEIIAILLMLCYRPHAWCVVCPMGTLTQSICRAKAAKTRETSQ